MIKRILKGVFLTVFLSVNLLVLANIGAADVYKIDAVHSSVGFSISHLMVSKTTGVFNEFEGTITFDPNDLSQANAEVLIQTVSIDTRNGKRDDHLRSADFFDAATNPQISFKSKQFTASGDQYLITGDLTMKGVTKEISIPVKITGPVASPMGSTVIGLSGQITLNRQDFGITWNKSLDNGGVVVGDEVEVNINIEAQK